MLHLAVRRAARHSSVQMKRKADAMADSLHSRAMSRIQLNPKEQQLRSLLVDVARYADNLPGKREPTVLRWAGGWVRDRVLGTQSYDIDVAINNMTGYTFAEKIRDYCENPENRGKHAMSEGDIGHLHVVKKNPEKSKNLETGTTKLFGLELDFVNLRKEVYHGDSRNPEMEFGTAQEDAERRDATINALFYNLQTGQLEDFTGGLQDMEAKVIRTPLEPFKTFYDDPLRVLRLVRFAARLDFTIDPKTEEAMSDERILERFRVVITRERVGIEVEKMLRGKRPRSALQLIDRLGLYHIIFMDPTNPAAPKPDTKKWQSAYDCLGYLSEKSDPLLSTLATGPEERYLAWLLAALVPWSQVREPEQLAGDKKRKKQSHWATAAVREGIKAPTRVCDLVEAASRNRLEILRLKSCVDGGTEDGKQRDKLGLSIMKWNNRGLDWKLQVLYAMLVDVFEHTLDVDTEGRTELLSSWQGFLDHLAALNLLEVTSLRPLVNGNELAKALDVRPGQWMTRALEICLAWQLRNPNKTSAAEAIEEVQRRRDELGI
jgi:tRNA nucleotidyltransferase (CCA-adding enzyme)